MYCVLVTVIPQVSFCITGISLPVVITERRDLVLHMIYRLADIVFKAHQQANFIRRCFVSCNSNLPILACNSATCA